MSNDHKITWFGNGIENSPNIRRGPGSVEDIVSHNEAVYEGLEALSQSILNDVNGRVESVPEFRTGGVQVGHVGPDGGTKLDHDIFLHDTYDDENFAAEDAERRAKHARSSARRIAMGKPVSTYKPAKAARSGAAISIENGHWTGKNKTGTWVPGLHIIQGAIDNAVAKGASRIELD